MVQDLALMLRPAGGGQFTVSTGKREQLELQRQIYRTADAEEIEATWRTVLSGLGSARVAILGIPSDCGAGLVRGAAYGPQALRRTLLHDQVLAGALLARDGVIDVGDVLCVPQLLHDEMLSEKQLAATRAALYPDLPPARAARLPVSPLSLAERAINLMLQANPDLKLMVLGGDHTVAWPVLAALHANMSPADRESFAIVQIDAHTDLLPDRLGVKYCFATWAYHANKLLAGPGHMVQLGIRTSSRPREH